MNYMLKSMVLLSFGLHSLNAFTQNPGNVGTPNLTAWFTPDALPNGDVINWTTTFSSLGPITVTDAVAPHPQVTNIPANNVSNYNKTLFFSGNTPTNLQCLENLNQLDLLQNFLGGTQGTFLSAYYFPSGNLVTNNHMMLYNRAPHAIQMRNLGANGRIAIGQSGTNTVNASREWVEDFVPNIVSYQGNRTTATSMKGFERGVTMAPGLASQSTGPTGLYFGNYPGNATAPYNGYLHEFIFYDRDLTPLELSKVHTYLAIKYGVTLDNAGGGTFGDYTATNGNLIWDASVNPTYHNNVIGIGRDDNQGLMQKQSHAFNDNYRIFMDVLAPTNAANVGIISNSVSYLTAGQTSATSCGTTISNLEAPATIQARIAKEWKFTNTDFLESYSIDLKIDTCQLIGSTVGAVNPANFRLLIDLDGDFTNASVFSNISTPGLGFAYNSLTGYVTISGISASLIPINTTRYLTLGYNNPVPYFTGNHVVCNGDSIAVTVNVLFGSGPTNVSYSNGTTTTTLIAANNGDIIYLSPTTNTNYTVFGSTNFLNCCGSHIDSTFAVTVNPIPNVIANTTFSTLCQGDSTQLSGAGATSYVWNNGAINLGYVTPLITTTYQVIGTNSNGCIDSASVTITVNANPIVTAASSALVVCSQDPVTLNGGGAISYTWNNSVVNNLSFNPISTATYIVTGTNGAGCTDTASITVVVNPLPTVVANTSEAEICINFPTTVFGSGATSYTWNNGVANSISFQPLTTLWYTVTGTDANGCMDVDSIQVTVNQEPNVIANASSTTICDNLTTQLTGSGASTYTWDNGVLNGDFVSPNVTTTYTVTGTDINGCVNNMSITINVNPSPIVTASATNNLFCAGSQVTLIGGGANSYVWNNGVIDGAPFNPTTTQTYIVGGANAFGCLDTASITITVYPLPNVQANASAPGVCSGFPATLAGSGASSYSWNNGITDGVSFIPNFTNTYTVVGTDINGCQNSDNVVLNVYPIEDFFLGADDTICPQNPVNLSGNAAFTTYLWNTGSNSPIITVAQAGTFSLTVTDANGCTYSDAQVIYVGDDCFPVIFIPNAFTPNSDEFNGSLKTVGDNIDKFEIIIYNRWGEVLFISKDIDHHWDGTYKGVVCPDGIYSYLVNYTTNAGNDDKLRLNGNFSILR